MAQKSLSEMFAMIPASGGATIAKSTPAVTAKTKFPVDLTSLVKKSASSVAGPMLGPVGGALSSLYAGGSLARTPQVPAPVPTPARTPVATQAPNTPTPLINQGGDTLFRSSNIPQPGPTGPTGPVDTRTEEINPRYVNPDGTYKTAEQVAAEIAASMRTAHEGGDIGNLAVQQFGGGPKTTQEAEAEARRITNLRNDIASGENDPYGVASDSGIAYTAGELAAIEKAYSGIYDPALDTALAKVTQKQREDEARAKANEPFTLGKDQVRFDADGNPIAVGLSDSGSSVPATYVAGANPTVDAYVKGLNDGKYKPSDIPDEYKAIVAQGAAQTPFTPSKEAVGAISNIEYLLNTPGAIEDITGGSNLNPITYVPGSKETPARNKLNQLAGALALENRKLLNGQGAISNFEFEVLQQAATDLGVKNGTSNLSPQDIRKSLEKLNLKLQVGPTNLTDEQLLYLKNGDPAEGLAPMTIDEIREYSQHQSFNSVGNTKASTVARGTGNVPQRNFNPGNVKAGGLADSLAIGKDEQGHLIFPDQETGFKALAADLTAKINGNSRHLPPNPTIEQLGKVYAEDGTWGKKVAALLGVPITTHTQTIPINQLMKAIATQEGFYA